MAYPRRLLTEGEEVVRQFRPHWRLLVIPVVWAVLGVAMQATVIGGTQFQMLTAPPHRRPSYVGFLNTVTSPLTLLPLAGAWLVGAAGVRALFAILIAGGLLYTWAAGRMRGRRAVAEEARVTAESMGQRVTLHYDVGVAGLHRLLACSRELSSASAIVVLAGMEGALASVVGGLVASPVIAVPTSIGYGASFGGLAALLAMLNSCASNVSVVNIDNGFGGGYIAALIARSARPRQQD